VERRPDEGEGSEGPVPADAPVETPEADPRTRGAPGGERSVDDDHGAQPEEDEAVEDEPDDDTIERQIQEAFEEGGAARGP
jgi:hypothetical protein